jgi:diadenosine tetraphosphate (Ap4A) HIT family hydrolase
MKKSTCCICSQIAGDASNDLLAQLIKSDEYVRRVALESKSFAIIPSIGPLTAGHVLLCPKRHFRSFAQMPIALGAEFTIMKAVISKVLAEIYVKPIHHFEHGSAKKSQHLICTVEHAHLHCVPTDVEIWCDIKDRFEWQRITNLSNLASFVGDMEYLWYESAEGFSFVTKGLEGAFESQYLRKVFAKNLGIRDAWNWRTFPRIQMVADTYRRMQPAIHPK